MVTLSLWLSLKITPGAGEIIWTCSKASLAAISLLSGGLITGFACGVGFSIASIAAGFSLKLLFGAAKTQILSTFIRPALGNYLLLGVALSDR